MGRVGVRGCERMHCGLSLCPVLVVWRIACSLVCLSASC